MSAICQAGLVQHMATLTLLPGLGNSVPIVRVDNEDDTLGVLEVCSQANRSTSDERSIHARCCWCRKGEVRVILTVSPQRPDLVLTTNVPHGERNVLVVDSFDIESYMPRQARTACGMISLSSWSQVFVVVAAHRW